MKLNRSPSLDAARELVSVLRFVSFQEFNDLDQKGDGNDQDERENALVKVACGQSDDRREQGDSAGWPSLRKMAVRRFLLLSHVRLPWVSLESVGQIHEAETRWQ